MIVGLVGPVCAGKDAASIHLQAAGFEMISLGDVLREEMRAQGITLTREAIQNYANNLRASNGADALARKAVMRIIHRKDYVVQGFRNPAELVPFLNRSDFVLVALDASAEIRFERMRLRAREKDPTTLEAFRAVDAKELGKGQTGTGLQIGECMKLAHHTIINEGSDQMLKTLLMRLVEERRAFKKFTVDSETNEPYEQRNWY